MSCPNCGDTRPVSAELFKTLEARVRALEDRNVCQDTRCRNLCVHAECQWGPFSRRFNHHRGILIQFVSADGLMSEVERHTPDVLYRQFERVCAPRNPFMYGSDHGDDCLQCRVVRRRYRYNGRTRGNEHSFEEIYLLEEVI